MGRGRTVNGSRTLEKSAIMYKRWEIHGSRGMRKRRTVWSRISSKSRIINAVTISWIRTMNRNITMYRSRGIKMTKNEQN